jgi:hypothetical protein
MKKIRDEVLGTAKVTYVKKKALYADECDCCGALFQMRRVDEFVPENMEGEFSSFAEGEDGHRYGGAFEAIVCSFACADKLFKGGWKKLEKWKPYVQVGAELKSISLSITSDVMTEHDLIREWEGQKENDPPQTANWFLHDVIHPSALRKQGDFTVDSRIQELRDYMHKHNMMKGTTGKRD